MFGRGNVKADTIQSVLWFLLTACIQVFRERKQPWERKDVKNVSLTEERRESTTAGKVIAEEALSLLKALAQHAAAGLGIFSAGF